MLALALLLALAPPPSSPTSPVSPVSPVSAPPPSEAPVKARDAQAKDGLEATVRDEPAPKDETRTYVSFRVGAATTSERPQLCLEATPLAMLGIEACGTGGGFLHNAPGTDISHFRGKVRIAAVDVEGVQVEPWIAAGFAELQVAGDVPGFEFTGTSAGEVSTAGPDVGGSVRALFPLGAGFELVGEVGVGVAFFSHARALVIPQDPLQPQAQVNVGVGF